MSATRHPHPGFWNPVKSTWQRSLALVAALLTLGAACRAVGDTITSLQDLQRAVGAKQRVQGDLDLTAIVCAADPVIGMLALKDDSGLEVLELDLPDRRFFPGDRIRLSTTNCQLIRRQGAVALSAQPVVDNGGSHGVMGKSGRIHLEAGWQPIRLFYFNAANPAELVVNYRGPGIATQPIPATALFHNSPGVTGQPGPLPGLEYFCYDDTPAILDEVRHQIAALSGTAADFDIGLRVPEEYVAMQFRGLLTVPRTGDYDFTVRSDDGSELYVGGFCPNIEWLGSNALPGEVRPPSGQTAAVPDGCEWAGIQGRVTFAGRQADGLQLDLQGGAHSTRLWLPNPANLSPSLLLNSRVRATGVLRTIIAPDGERRPGLMSVVGAENFRVEEIAAEQWGRYDLTQITNVAGMGTEKRIVRLRGQVTKRRADGGFILADGLGTITVTPAGPDLFTNGTVVEVLGQLTQAGLETQIWPAYCRRVTTPSDALPTLTSAAEVQQLTVDEAARAYPVRVLGVVTAMEEWHGAVVQDDTRGVFFKYDADYQDDLGVGNFVEITGVTAAGNFAPVINAKSLRVLGRGQMPEPVSPNWNELINGSLDSQYAEVRGVITAVEGNTVTLLTDSGKISVQIYNTGEAALRRLKNTLIRIRGCLQAEWDRQTRHVRVGEIKFRNPIIEVDQQTMSEPFSAPAKSISDLFLFDLQDTGFQRVKMSGQIVHVGDGEFFLMQDGKGLRFQLVGETDLQAGDMVDVVGIPDVSQASPLLKEAVARKTGSAPLPAPLSWSDATTPAASPDAVLIQTEALLIALHHNGPDWVLELQTGLRTCRALVQTPVNLAVELPLNSRLRLTGVYAASGRNEKDNLEAFELLLNSAADIELLERPPWWNLRRFLVTIAALITVLAAAALWITQLHRKVEQRTRLLEREHGRREHAERERALEVERSRIARDLHDDLGSSLTEIRVMASTGLRSPPVDERSTLLFKSIFQKARSLVSALDVIVWAVNPEANTLQSLADYLGSYTENYLANAGITCRFRIPVTLPAVTLEGQVRHELFLAVKETLNNIVRHSRATEVEFHLRLENQLLEIDIMDNGCGFDLNAASHAGHGIKNIPKRLAHLGGSGELISRPGQGTTVRLRLPLPGAKEA
jgi:signal transduction histidine kinase